MYISIKKLKLNSDTTRRLVVPDQTIKKKKKKQHGIISLFHEVIPEKQNRNTCTSLSKS